MVSIITPIYGVEKFIERCARSLFEQDYEDIEYIFVDDHTKDSSIEILTKVAKEYPQRKIKILHHDTNQGLPAARNTGLAAATGSYILHCDSDDYVEKDMISTMMKKAEETKADIIYSDFYLSFGTNERRMPQPTLQTAEEALEAMLSGTMKYNVWNKLARRSLYTDFNIHFPHGHSMGEDMTMIMLCCNANKVAHTAKASYHYVQMNEGALTKTRSQRQLDDTLYNTCRCCDYITQTFGEKKKREQAYFKLNVKYTFLISPLKSDYTIWHEWFPEANQHIMQNKTSSLRSRLIQTAAKHHQHWLLWLHYKLIHKLIYGLIYK